MDGSRSPSPPQQLHELAARVAGVRHNHSGVLLDVDALCTDLEKLGLEWADAKAAADALEDASKGILGLCFKVAEGSSREAKEFSARNDARFLNHLRELDKARKRALRARVAYDVQQVRVELARSNASTERALAVLR
jgi:hypothetical protein